MSRRFCPYIGLEELESRRFLSSTPAVTLPIQIDVDGAGHIRRHRHKMPAPITGVVPSVLDSGISLSPTVLVADTAPLTDEIIPAAPAAPADPLANLGDLTWAAPPIVAITAPVAAFVSSTASTIQIAATVPTGGLGSYTYQWYRGTSAGFTPSAANALPNATSLTLTDSASPSPGVPYFYVLGVTDGFLTATSNQVIGALTVPTRPVAWTHQAGPVVVGYLGSSTWAINQGSGQIPSIIDQSLHANYPGRSITMINGAVSGTSTANYLPRQSYNTNLKTALQAASGYKVLRLMIGSNDARGNVPVATWLANMQSIINNALTWPVDMIVLEEIGLRTDGGNATIDLIRQYNAARSSLLGPKVVLGTAYTFENQATHLSTLTADNVHQNDAGQREVATNQTTEISTLFS